MPCTRIGSAIMCSNTVHKVGDFTVEFPKIGCPVALKPSGELYDRIPGGRDKFYKAVTRFLEEQFTVTLSTLAERFADDLVFDSLEHWCSVLKIVYEEPLDDDMPDWEDGIRAKIANELMKRRTK